MQLTAAFLLLLPFVSAEVQRVKLHKLPQTADNRIHEVAYLAEKYGAGDQLSMNSLDTQIRYSRPTHDEEGKDLFWTQDQEVLNGGHSVPLTSSLMSLFTSLCRISRSSH